MDLLTQKGCQKWYLAVLIKETKNDVIYFLQTDQCEW